MYSKKPDELSPEESDHFPGYQQYKRDNGLSIEEDFVYKPDDIETNANSWVVWFLGGHAKNTNNTKHIVIVLLYHVLIYNK